MKIKSKIMTTVVAIVISAILNQIQSKYIDTHLEYLYLAEERIQLIKIDILELRKLEKDFLARKDLKYVDNFDKRISELKKNIKNEKDFLLSENIDTKALVTLENIVNRYSEIFNKLVDAQKTIGLSPENGLYGSLRDSVHKVQEMAKNINDDSLYAKILTLRKHEKILCLELIVNI